MRYQAIQDDLLMIEMYEQLLLETPATKANIQRFIKKYYNLTPESPGGPGGAEFANEYESLVQPAIDFLNSWSSKVQQTIKAAGGSPDIFAYSSLEELQAALDSASFSKTEAKKVYKRADDSNVPVVQETDTYIAYQPLTWEASRKYFGETRISLLDGQQKKGSHWCTAASDSDKFKDYVVKNKNRLIYFIRKKDDKLFAARSMRTDSPAAEKSFDSWMWNVYDLVKDIQKIENSVEYATAKKARDKWAIDRFDYKIRGLIINIQPTRNSENRRQDNHPIIFGLAGLFSELNPKKHFELAEYINFVAFVVFGKTIQYEIPSSTR